MVQDEAEEQDQKMMELEDDVQVDATSLIQELLEDQEAVQAGDDAGPAVGGAVEAADDAGPDVDGSIELEDDDDSPEILPRSTAPSQSSVMSVGPAQDELALFCTNHGISHLLPIFKEHGFDSVRILVKMQEKELREIGLRLGEVMTCEDIFEKHRNNRGAKENQNWTNIHVERRKINQAQQQGGCGNDWNPEVEEKLVGKQRIKSNRPMPNISVQRALRDKVINVFMNECESTDCKTIRTWIDRRTKNGAIANVRYYYDEETKSWPNSPVNLAYNAGDRLKNVGLITIQNEKFVTRGMGGNASWSGTVRRIVLSGAWNEATPQKRRDLYHFVKDTSGVNWIQYATKTNDELNCRAIGLIGSAEPQYNLTLNQIIAANNNNV